jgi:uncharacterized iron-regulated protein
VILLAGTPLAAAPDTLAVPPDIRDASGAPSSIEALLAAVAVADVVFLGEQHDDVAGQRFQALLLQRAHERLGASRGVVLAMEMFERDVQHVLEEYLAGLIREQDFLAAARPWSNYADSYRPLVEYAREHGLRVVGSNVPSRYANLVAREGEAALERLPRASRAALPPLPVPPPSAPLAAAFRSYMESLMDAHGGAHGHAMDLDALLAAQNLRDAAMARSITEALARQPGALVVHVNGAFHSDGHRGIPEHLRLRRDDLRVVVVSLRPASRADEGPEGSDFVVVTESAP